MLISCIERMSRRRCLSQRRLSCHLQCQRPCRFLRRAGPCADGRAATRADCSAVPRSRRLPYYLRRRRSCRCWPRRPSLPAPTAELPLAPVFVPLPAPTTEPLFMPTAVPLPAPTAMPVPALTVVPLRVPTAVTFNAHADCRTTFGADGHANAGPDCRDFHYQRPSCLLPLSCLERSRLVLISCLERMRGRK